MRHGNSSSTLLTLKAGWPMPIAKTAGGYFRRGFRGRELLLLVVILALAASLATRFVYLSSSATVTSVKSASPDNHRQRLHQTGARWTAPVDEFTVFVSSLNAHLPPPPPPLLVVHLDDSLYNRPPPSC
jgi:hypothetical protein